MKKRIPLLLALLVAGGFAFLMTNCNPTPAYDDSSAIYKEFSGANAFEHLEQFVGLGEKTPGSEGHKKAREYLLSELSKLGWSAKEESFTTDTPDGETEFFNIRARFSKTADPDLWGREIKGLVSSHYDTKKFSFNFVGANDGGSSSAALIEIARVLRSKPEIASQIELVWFDGEEAFGTNITDDDGLFGSKHYAARIAEESKENPKMRPEWGLLLDMIGDMDLKIRAGVNISPPPLPDQKDAESKGQKVDHAAVTERRRQIAAQLIDAAKDADNARYFGISPSYIIDDHVPLNTIAGVPTIDIIDFDYDYWHTPGDTLDKISAESLEITGQTTILLIEKYLIQ